MTNEELTKTYFNNRHILQSPQWGEFKTLMGTRAITIDKAQLTTHKIPHTPWKIGYLPKVRPQDLNLEKVFEIGKKENFIFIKLDVPHAPHEFKAQSAKCKVVEGRAVFAKSTILMDLTKTDEELLSGMHEKARYNLRLAQKKGVKVIIYPQETQENGGFARRPLEEALGNFIKLQEETAKRQGFFIHPANYYRNCFNTLSTKKMAYLVSAEVDNETAASWILFRYGDVLYYPYGESNYELRSYMPSNLLMWEAIQLGKKLGCKVFDLWGAANNPDDEKDPWHGFTRFKLSFGGSHIKLPPTQDLVINKPLYNIFNLSDKIRWGLLRAARKGYGT